MQYTWPGHFSIFLLTDARRKYLRRRHGDLLGSAVFERDNRQPLIWASFRSILQGDHAGVEIATAAHSQLLKDYGLLHQDSQLKASSPCFSCGFAEGLVIDDYFAVSIDDRGVEASESGAFRAYQKAQLADGKNKLLGSPEKDVIAEKEGKAIGAYVNGSDRATSRGVCPVSAPPEKKLALSFLTLHLCCLPYTTVSLHRCIVGAWVSILLFRRPMMSLLNEAFRLVSQHENEEDSKLISLPRKVAEELVLVSTVAPIILSDIATPFSQTLYASDASEERGAVRSTTVGEDVVQLLCKCFKTKGAYTRLSSPWSCLLQRIGLQEELPEEQPAEFTVDRPLAFSFAFIEAFAGSSRVTKALSEFGIVCGPPIDLSKSEEYNVAFLHVVSWLFHLIEQPSLRGLMLEPPCTSFSNHASPCFEKCSPPLRV